MASLPLNATITGKKMKKEVQVVAVVGVVVAGAGEREEVVVDQMIVTMILRPHPTCLVLQAQHHSLISLTPK